MNAWPERRLPCSAVFLTFPLLPLAASDEGPHQALGPPGPYSKDGLAVVVDTNLHFVSPQFYLIYHVP